MNVRSVLAGLVTAALAAIVVVGLVVGPVDEGDRVDSLSRRLRCPQCQGESIAESNAQTARTMVAIVGEQVAAGRSDDQIIDYFTQRYGEWVLLDPPFSGRTLVLWLLPLAMLAAGIWLLVNLRRPRPAPERTPPDPAARLEPGEARR